MSDLVNSPSHYQKFDKEAIHIIRFVLGEEGFRAYCQGCSLKYRLRAGHKNDAAEDIAKALKYEEFAKGDDK